MKADEIRKFLSDSLFEGKAHIELKECKVPEHLKLIMLTEIAAQLAELNQKINDHFFDDVTYLLNDIRNKR